ncbi:hypothetical protein HDE68_002723 [Pedobacter cryoconitis]|uniref:Suppressor of fused-like domain-containing protein n=1 Tax=Pedobacter cryoconitis TaxID=188932 RepID=A0A7W8ZMY8_9SPHI|nr:suppressor of fused domain protein [Pedobacter cryoconitis]MBB5636810.1 hypothetical protein [Pedobacter cryoconitis]
MSSTTNSSDRVCEGYIEELTLHYQAYFGLPGKPLKLTKGPTEKLHSDFVVLEFPPTDKNAMFCYCTVGMSVDRSDDHLIELFVYAPKADMQLVELLTVCASYHRNKSPLGLDHTVNIGQPWLDNSKCDHGFISWPYLDGEDLAVFEVEGKGVGCYWLIPITEQERDYKIEAGTEALEQLFEDKGIDYLNSGRESLV